jgi:hypothetical protein
MKLQTSEEELFAGLQAKGRYDHLKLFLSRKNEPRKLPMYFLWVSREAVGKVLLDDVDFDGSCIHLSIEDCTTGLRKLVPVDINDHEFQFLLISWDDIRSMVQMENKPMLNSNELLDFE